MEKWPTTTGAANSNCCHCNGEVEKRENASKTQKPKEIKRV